MAPMFDYRGHRLAYDVHGSGDRVLVLVDANSVVEWGLTPGRLNEELAGFLAEVWRQPGRSQAVA